MTELSDLRERIARLEQDVKHATKSIETMVDKLDGLHDLLNQAKGGWRVGMAFAGLGGAIAGFLLKWWGVPH